MRAGTLRHLVQVQRSTTSTNAAGEPSPKGWTTVAEVWASIEPLSGRELYSAQQSVPQVTHAVTTRGPNRLTANSRILFRGRVFQLLGAGRDKDERGILVDALAVEVTDG